MGIHKTGKTRQTNLQSTLLIHHNIKMYLQKVRWGGGHGLDWSGSGYRQMAGSNHCGNEPSGSIKLWNFLTSWGPLASQEGLCSTQNEELLTHHWLWSEGQIQFLQKNGKLMLWWLVIFFFLSFWSDRTTPNRTELDANGNILIHTYLLHGAESFLRS